MSNKQQVNIASRNSVAGNGNVIIGGGSTTVNGYQIDPSCKPYGHLRATKGGCIIDGHVCELKEINGLTVWTYERNTINPEYK